MRIGPNISDLQGISSSRADNSSSLASAGKSAGVEQTESFPEDMVSLSSLKSKAMQTPDVREEKVASLQQSVASGLYQLNPKAIAAAMMGEE